LPLLLQYRTGLFWGGENKDSEPDILLPGKIVLDANPSADHIACGKDAVIAVQVKYTDDAFILSDVTTALLATHVPGADTVIPLVVMLQQAPVRPLVVRSNGPMKARSIIKDGLALVGRVPQLVDRNKLWHARSLLDHLRDIEG
jgi:hypothetical protein